MSDTPSAPGKPPSHKELSGRIGKYEITRPLGKGAMGMVYLAHDTVLERDVALKVMVAQIADDPELTQRFEREARAVARMTHPNVVMVFDLGYHVDGSPFIAMELLKGNDLQKAMRQQPPLALDTKVEIIVQTLAGLAHAHQAGIVHRDIKPANIFINADGSVKIMDFGVARLTTGSMTGTGNIVGTADYMSPEQVKGARVDGRSDLFSVGCMLYELVAGRRPFHSDNLMAIFYKITHEAPDWTSVPEGPEYEALLPIVEKALAKDLDSRYQTAYEFAVALRDYLKIYATGSSAQRATENLADLQAPTSPGYAPITEPGPTVVTDGGPTSGTGRAARSGTGTVRGSAPTVIGGPGTTPPTVMPAPRPASRPSQPSRPLLPQASVRPARSSAGPAVFALLGVLGVGVLTVGGYFAFQQLGGGTRQITPVPTPETPTTAPPTAAPTAVPTEVPTTVATAAPPTVAPQPTLAETKGKGAGLVRSAQTAIGRGDYDRAVAQAQEALQEDPSNRDAKRVLDNAMAGQKAEPMFASAEAALGRKDYAQATADAERGRELAPWDSRGPGLLQRIQRAQQGAAQQAAAETAAAKAKQLRGLLAQADNALAARNYDTAISLYNEVLSADPSNDLAIAGRSSAVGARALSQAGGGGPAPAAGKSFIQGETVAQSAETRNESAVPTGFEAPSGGMVVKKGSQAAELPGRIRFEVDPDVVKAGQKYTVKVLFINQGLAPIRVSGLIVTSSLNGRKSSGPVPPLVKDVAPQQRAALLSLPDFWKEDTTTWSMEVVVTTDRGETYRNTLTWR